MPTPECRINCRCRCNHNGLCFGLKTPATLRANGGLVPPSRYGRRPSPGERPSGRPPSRTAANFWKRRCGFSEAPRAVFDDRGLKSRENRSVSQTPRAARHLSKLGASDGAFGANLKNSAFGRLVISAATMRLTHSLLSILIECLLQRPGVPTVSYDRSGCLPRRDRFF